ncbi:tyramine N-feruloyltransferase [Salix suchowensis]|nr:tyramine N-feruloyltransferase [Salix suchowensis]
MSVSKMSLKLLIDSKHNKVIFGEAGKDFVDFLLNLLALPLGNVIQLLTKSAMTGCVANLYESLEKLDGSYLQPNQNKDSILKPIITTEATNPNFLLPNTKKPENQKLYYCRNHPGCVSDIQNSVCSQCRSQGYGTCYLNEEVNFAGTNDSTSTDTPTTDQGGYVKGLVTYMVTNDLSVSPMSMVSGVSLLNKFNIKDFGVLEEKVVQFGINEGIELLKASLLSKDALTAVFLLKDKDGAPVSN